MKMTKLIILISLIFSLVGCQNKSNIFQDRSLEELMRLGYDLRDDKNFEDLCNILNDSISNISPYTKWIYLTPVLYEEDNSMEWEIRVYPMKSIAISETRSLSLYIEGGKVFTCYLEEVPEDVLQANSLTFEDVLNIVLNDVSQANSLTSEEVSNPDNNISLQHYHYSYEKTPIDISQLDSLANDYIYNPDISYRRVTHMSMQNESLGDIEFSVVYVTINMPCDKDNKPSVSDWKIFYDCLEKLIKVFDDERDRWALKFFGSNFNSISFEQKSTLTEFIVYPVNIFFNQLP